MSDLAEKTTSVILGPDGEQATIPTRILSDADARLLREYKKFLQRVGLREALFCNTCWSGEKDDGCRAHVTSSQILIQCRCQIRFFQGQAY